MNNSKSKKELQAQYREREIIGGVCAIRNTQNNKILLEATVNLHSSKNRFEFSQKTGSCVYLKLQNDWNEQGGDTFVFEILEELKKSDTQSERDFKADVDLLLEIWRDKLLGTVFY